MKRHIEWHCIAWNLMWLSTLLAYCCKAPVQLLASFCPSFQGVILWTDAQQRSLQLLAAGNIARQADWEAIATEWKDDRGDERSANGESSAYSGGSSWARWRQSPAHEAVC